MSHKVKRKITNEDSTNEEPIVDKRQDNKKSCTKQITHNGIFDTMMTNARYLGSNMAKFRVNASDELDSCYYCGVTENIEECYKCKSKVCYLRSGCSMLNNNDESNLYCLDCI